MFVILLLVGHSLMREIDFRISSSTRFHLHLVELNPLLMSLLLFHYFNLAVFSRKKLLSICSSFSGGTWDRVSTSIIMIDDD